MNRISIISILTLILIGVGCSSISKKPKTGEIVTVYDIDNFPENPFENCPNVVSDKLETFVSEDSLFTIEVQPHWQYKYYGVNKNKFQRHVWYNTPDTTNQLVILIDVDTSRFFFRPNMILSQDSCEWAFYIERAEGSNAYDYWHYFACFSDKYERNYYFFVQSQADNYNDVSFDISCDYKNSLESLVFFK